MKRFMKCLWIMVSVVVMLLVAMEVMAAVPASPSIITMNGKQMRVQHRREDNTLKAAVNYVIKGVGYSVSTVWPVETYPPGAPFENDDRRRSWEMAQYDFPRIKEAGFNTIRLYSDLGLNTDSTLYFDEDTNGVIWNEDGTAQDDDSDHQEDWLEGMPMLGDLNAQAVTNGLAVLDEAYKNGLKVIMVVDGLNANSAIAQKIINTYKNHPAILMWQLGNEFNYNSNDQLLYMWRYDTLLEACQAIEDIASWIQANDSNHPVSACLGEPSVPSYSDFKTGVSAMTDIDVLGLNCYRGRSFKDLYEVMTDTISWNKPIYISEYGVDSWHYNTDPTKEFEDIASQKEGTAWQWDDIHNRLSAINVNNTLLGGCVFDWVDEWWKLKGGSPLIHDITPGYPVNVNEPPSTDLYPDGCMHEEWWGLNSQNTKNTTSVFYADAGLIGEARGGEQSWDIYTWGLPVEGNGYGKINSQSDYVLSGSPDNGMRRTYSPYPEYAYTGVDTIPEGHRCMYTELWSTSYGGGWGLFRTKDTIDLSQYANGNIKFWLKLQKAGTPPTAIGDTAKANYCFKFEDESGKNKAVFVFLDESYCSEFNANSTAWQEITIPISVLCDGHSYAWLDYNNIKQAADGNHKANMNLAKMKMVFSFSGPKLATGDANTQFWVDNVRWDTGFEVVYNRTAKPALKDYRNKFNTLNYLKTVFEAGATSYMGAAKSARLTKNYSAVVSTYTVATPYILAAAINSKTGRIIATNNFTDATSLNNWVDLYDNAGNDYVLSFAKYNTVSFLSSCIKLGTVGSTMYTTASGSDPWVFVTHAVNGSSVAKKESIGSSSLAEVYLPVDLDSDSDGLLNINDADADGDGLTNTQEIRYGTDALDTDTDDDTYSDSTEVSSNTNARNPDSKVLSTDTQAKLIVKPQTLSYGNSEIQTNKDRYLYIENDGGEYLSYKVDIAYTNGSGWLTVKYRNHTSNEAWTSVTTGSYLYKDLDDYVLQVLVDTSTMTTAQTYAANITITANDDDGVGSGSQVINVSVPIAAELNVFPENIVVKKPETAGRIYIENSGCTTVSYTISQIRPVSWLTINPGSGSATTETDLIDLTVNWTGLTADTSTVVKVDAGTAGVKYITVNLDDSPKYGLDTPLSNVDASYDGLQTNDFRECEEMATGDVNNDGLDDILIGALQYFTSENGKAYLFLGKKEGWTMGGTVADAIQFMGTPDDNSVYAGSGVAIADVNGDGYKDVIIGDKCALTRGYGGKDYWQCMSGCIYIFFNPMAKGETWKSMYGLIEADVIIRSCFETGQPNGWEDLGDVIRSGDFNNDGYDDLVVGGDNSAPAAYIIWGRQQSEWNNYLAKDLLYLPNGYTLSNLPRVQNPDHTTNFPDVTRLYHSQRGWISYHNWYEWVDHITVGDLDNDGYDDIVLGNLENPDASGIWYRYVIYGKAGKQSVWGGNIDVYNNLNAAIPIKSYNDRDWGAMSAAGDINGDGCYDLLISTECESGWNGGNIVWLLLGNTTKWTTEKILESSANANFVVPDDIYSSQRAIYDLQIAKDMNGDAYDEVVVNGYVAGSGWRAKTFTYLGRSSISGTIDLGTSANASFIAEQNDDVSRLFAMGSGDFNGDGYHDLIEVHGVNDQRVLNGGRAYVILSKKFITSSDKLVYQANNETSKSFYIKNVSLDGTSIDWTATKTASWITSVSPNSGTGLTGDSSTQITVTVSRSGLGDGVYTDYITLTSGGYSYKLLVKLIVGKIAPPVCNTSPEHVAILGTTGTVDITNIGGGTMNWTINENEPWITNVNPASGTTGTETDTVTITVNWSGYTTDQTGKITITYDNGVQKDVYVTMAKPKIRIGSTYYSTIQAAYNAATIGQTIQVQEGTFTETLTFNRAAIAVTIEGGYDNTWNNTTGKTTRIVGNVTESSSGGSVTFGSTGAVSIQ